MKRPPSPVTATPDPLHLSGWRQGRLFPPHNVVLHVTYHIRTSEGAGHLGLAMQDGVDGPWMAIESMPIFADEAEAGRVQLAISTWIASARGAFEPF